MSEEKHSVSVAGVVVDAAGRVLVIRRRDDGQWQPPGGVLELGETFQAGLEREVLEETGVPVTVGRLTGVYQNLTLGVVALVFRCTPHGDADPDSAEADAVRWVDPATVPDLMAPAFAVRVTDAFATGPVTRAHDGVNLARAEHGVRQVGRE